MNFLMTVTDSYVPYLGVTITSIIENNRHMELSFYIICPDLSVCNKSKLGGVINCKSASNVSIHFLELKSEHRVLLEEVGKHLRSVHNTSFLLRLLSEQLLPSNLNTILYMDVDVVVSSDLKELDNYVFHDNIGAAVVKDVVRTTDYQRLKINPNEHIYFNSGVMLINLPYWRENSIGQKCLKKLCENTDVSFMPDQDALNIILKGKVDYLHPKYNCLMLFFMRDEFLKSRIQADELKQVKEAIENPAIIHYVFLNKPWFKGGFLPKKELWLNYLSLTPWADLKLKWRNGYKGMLNHYGKQIIENIPPFFGFELRPNLFKKKQYNHIRFLFLLLYYGFAQWLPNFDSRLLGKFSNRIRIACVRRLFDFVGKDVNIGRRVKFGHGKNIRIGDRSNFGANCRVPSNIVIGDNVMMGPDCFFFGSFSHKTSDTSIPMIEQGIELLPGHTSIHDDIWIGQECLFMPNVEIKSHSIIGARTIVTKNVPQGVVFAGNPGKIRKHRLD